MAVNQKTLVLIRKYVHVHMEKELKTAVCAMSIHAKNYSQFLKNPKNYTLRLFIYVRLKKWMRYIKHSAVNDRTWIRFFFT